MTGNRYKVDGEAAVATEAPACRRTGECCQHGSARGIAARLAAEAPPPGQARRTVSSVELARAAGISYGRANTVLRDAVRDGKMVKVQRGRFALPGGRR